MNTRYVSLTLGVGGGVNQTIVGVLVGGGEGGDVGCRRRRKV